MTLATTARRAILIIVAVVSLTVVYLVGATRSGGAAEVGSNGTSNSSTMSNVSLPQAAMTAPVGSAGITVGGTADVAGTPDTLRLDLSVVATAATVSDALARANASAAAVQGSLLGDGVAKKDLQTSGLNISPEYDYPNNGTPRLKGYQVSEGVTAKLRDLGRAGDAIGKAVGAGGNAIRVNGVSLDLEDTGALVSKARNTAFADAKTKAEQYAKAAGRSLGDVVSITENVSTPSPIAVPDAAMARQAAVPIQPGSQTVGVSVTVVFALR